MNFEEAKALKALYGNQQTSNHVVFKIFVAPQNHLEFLAYCRAVRKPGHHDELAKLYCTDNNYQIAGFHFDGPDTLYSFQESFKKINKE